MSLFTLPVSFDRLKELSSIADTVTLTNVYFRRQKILETYSTAYHPLTSAQPLRYKGQIPLARWLKAKREV